MPGPQLDEFAGLLSSSTHQTYSGVGTAQPNHPIGNRGKHDSIVQANADFEDDEDDEVKDDSLPPKDGGRGAWLFLFGACVFEIVSWGKYHKAAAQSDPGTDTWSTGFPYSWGVFRAYLYTNGAFKGVEYVSVTGVMNNASIPSIFEDNMC
jgi:hypothetical protein